jgi:hypothetical protein
MQFRFADPAHFRAFLARLEYSPDATRICLMASFLQIEYCECPTLALFSENRAQMRTIATPRALYGYAVEVNEEGFVALLRRGALFVAFERRGCQACGDRAEAARQVATAAAKAGSRIAWAIWDTANALPSFLHALQLPIPSLWFFPSQNLSEAVFYPGNADAASIAKWAHAQARDFPIEGVLAQQRPSVRV